MQLVVGDVGFGQQHVHMAGHAAGHGMDRELDFDAALGRACREFADLVLRLRDGHAVSGNDDHACARLRECAAASSGLRRPHGLAAAAPRRGRATCPNAPNSTFVNDRFMALHMITDRMKPDDAVQARPR